MYVLIPAYQPDARLIALIDDLLLTASPIHVVVVDDGSGPAYTDVFSAARKAGAQTIGYEVNAGKGHALKYGFAHIREVLGDDTDRVVVCADADGQHSVVDILRVGAAVARTNATVLGARAFSGEVPLRSKFGNNATRLAMIAATRRRWKDTQTGLRGYPATLLDWLGTVPGERYEYEINLLLAASRQGVDLSEIDIATIYIDDNSSSHFRPVADSMRIYAPLLTFGAVSFGSFLIDFGLLFALSSATGALLFSVIAARLISSTFNFFGNRYLVFRHGTRSLAASAWRYWALVAALLCVNYLMLATLTTLSVGLATAKVLTEVTLFIAGYAIQHLAVFNEPNSATAARTARASQAAHSQLQVRSYPATTSSILSNRERSEGNL